MRLLFKASTGKKADGWMPMLCGNSGIDGEDYWVDTHYLHADEVPPAIQDAKTTAQLISGLLNAFYKEIDVSKKSEDEVIRMGTYIEEQDVMPANPNQKELPF